MITASQDYKDALAAGNRNYYEKVVITLWNGDTLNITNEDIWDGGFRFKQAVSDQSAFTIGACVIGEFKLILDNLSGAYDAYDFDGAEVVASFGLYDENGSYIDMDGNGATSIQKGVYFVDEVDTNGSLITLTCLDAMMFFDRSFADVALTFPATLKQIVSAMCLVCGVPFTQASFNNSTYTVNKRPDDTTLTCRDVLSMVCEIACCYGTIDASGELVIEFYNTAFMRTTVPVSGDLDGGSFYAGADNADGGSFYSLSTLHDAGTYEQDTTPDYAISQFFSFKRDNKDIRIYGVRVSSDSITYLNGSDLYVVDVEGNLLINGGDEDDLALFLGDQLIYASLRPFDASHLSDPTLEAGDTVVLTDHNGNTYYSVVTETEFSAGERQRTECNAKAAQSTSYARHQNISNARITATTFSNGDGAFNVTKEGDVTANKITANTGKLGGWNVDENGFYRSYSSTYRTRLKAAANASDYVFWVGEKSSGSNYALNLWILGDGTLRTSADTPAQIYYKAPHADGYYTNNYGDFIHSSSSATTFFSIMSYEGERVFGVYFENGKVMMPKVYSVTTSSAANVFIDSLGFLFRSTSSSKEYKRDITEKLDEDVEKLYDLPVIQFKYDDDYLSKDDQRYGQDIIGFLAEDVAKVMPGAVDMLDGKPEMWNVHIIVPAMLKLIQNQKKEINELTERIERLEKMMDKEATKDGDPEQER